MPNRILKESICTSESINALSAFEEIMFYRLIVTCDDYGRFDARPKILASRLFPLKNVREQQIIDALRKMTSEELVTLYQVGGKPFGLMNSWDLHQTIRAKKSKYPAPEGGTGTHGPLSPLRGQLPQGGRTDPTGAKNAQVGADGNAINANTCGRKANESEFRADANAFRASADSVKADEIICMQMNADAPVIQSESKTNPNTVCFNDVIGHSNAPTEIEVARYAKAQKLNVNVPRFMAYYERTGWMANGHPVTDWRAAVRYWATADERPMAGNIAPGFDQRTYTAEEYAAQTVDLRQYLNMGEAEAK